jgi:hypothetical protein
MDEDMEKTAGGSGKDSDWDKWYEALVYSVARQIEMEREKLKSDSPGSEPTAPQL